MINKINAKIMFGNNIICLLISYRPDTNSFMDNNVNTYPIKQ